MAIEEERLIGADATVEEQRYDRALRPQTLKEYIGQPIATEQLDIFLQAARQRGDALDHCLIFGPPGLGKTTLAHIIAAEMSTKLHTTSGPAIERAGDLAAMLSNLQHGDVLFIDEIHRLHNAIEEMLYPAMEDLQLDIMIGEGPAARSIKLDLPQFTLVAATTRAGMLTSPLRDRFGIVLRLEYYSDADLATIIERSANKLAIDIQSQGTAEIARRARGTPRIANRLLRRVRDYAQIKSDGVISQTTAENALKMLNVDTRGLDQLDRQLLLAVIERFHGGPVGLDSLAAALSEDKATIEDFIEPYLIQQGYLERTSRGRMAATKAYEHCQRKPTQSQSLFP